jgi:hypothetical protein
MKYVNDRFLVHRPSTGVDKNWHVVNSDDTAVAHCYGFDHDVPSGETLARRIAACLNACNGMSMTELEAMAKTRT